MNMIKLYHRKENFALYTIKETPNEQPELQCWEGRGDPQYKPEEAIISPALSPKQREEIKSILQKYKQVFSNKPGVAKGVVHKIDTGDAQPVAVTPYQIMGPYVGKVRAELDEMLKANIIIPSISPWAALIVLVDKPDGNICFCIDYQKLNHFTKTDLTRCLG